jgi:plastocyanin
MRPGIYLKSILMVFAFAVAGYALSGASPGHGSGKAKGSPKTSRQNPMGDGHKMPMRKDGGGAQGMPGKGRGSHKMPMQSKGMSMSRNGGGEMTLADAKQCRKRMLDGTEMMDEQQIDSCVGSVSRFDGAGGKLVTVRMKTDSNGRNYFEPAKVNINRGDTIKWVLDSGVHNSAAYPNRIPWDTTPWEFPLMTKPGDSFSRTFFSAGSYEYHCHPHETVGMKGVVVVERMSLASELRRSSKEESAHAHSLTEN